MRLLLVALVIAVAAPASANVGRRDFPGVRTAEPGGLRGIAIEREELTFDLRPLAQDGSAQIAATYHLDNRGETITAPLVFVSGSSKTGSVEINVQLDGKPVRGAFPSDDLVASFPASWRAPLTTPSLDGGAPHPYDADASLAYTFTLEIPPGRHTLAVTYRGPAELTRPRDEPTIRWQLAYVLAPARDWGAFGTLDVVVHVPADWRVAITPALERTGDTLRGRFAGLPGDSIGITTQARAGVFHTIVGIGRPILVLLVIAAGIYVLGRIGRARGRNMTNLGGSGMLAFACGLGWAVTIAVAGSIAALSGRVGIEAGQSAAYGYGPGLGVVLSIFGGLIAIPIGFVIVRIGVRRGSRTAAAQHERELLDGRT